MGYIKTETALKKKLITKFSPIYLIARELGLEYLQVENGVFTGPAVGLAVAVDRITSLIKINSVLDLFCGTGALSKIALLNGVEKVVCIDKNLKVAKEFLEEFSERVIFKEKDIFKVRINNHFDLAIIDAPQKIIPKVIDSLLPKLLKKVDLIIMWHGSCEEVEWNIEIRNKIRKLCKQLIELGYYGEELSLFTNSTRGKKMIKKLI